MEYVGAETPPPPDHFVVLEVLDDAEPIKDVKPNKRRTPRPKKAITENDLGLPAPELEIETDKADKADKTEENENDGLRSAGDCVPTPHNKKIEEENEND